MIEFSYPTTHQRVRRTLCLGTDKASEIRRRPFLHVVDGARRHEDVLQVPTSVVMPPDRLLEVHCA